MKKALVVLTAFAFVFTMAAPLFAAEVTVGGELRVRGRYRNCCDFDDSTATGAGTANRSRLDERYRIRVSAKIQEGLAAYVELESYGRFGMGTASPQATTLSVAGNEGAGVPGARFAWIDARLPGTPVTFRLGRQAQSFGHGYVFDTAVYGGDAITARGPLGGWNWQLGWVKTRETDTIAAASGYPAGYVQPGAAGPGGTDNDEEYWTFNIKGSPARNHSLEAYVVWHIDNGAFAAPGATGATAAVPFGTLSGGGANEATLGLAWDARLGPFVPRAEFNYQGGSAYKIARATNADIDRNAWAFNVGADYNLTPQWVFALDAALGSGQGKNPADADYQSNRAFFQPNALQSGPWAVTGDLGNPGPFTMGDPQGVTSRTFQIQGLTNLGFINLSAAWTPVPTWTVRVEAAKLWAHRTFDGMGGPVTGGRPSKDLGWNLGGHVFYRPYRNLTTQWSLLGWVPGGYFDNGLPDGVRKADTAWLARWYAIVSF